MKELNLVTAAQQALEKLTALSNRNALGDMEFLWTTIRDLRMALDTHPRLTLQTPGLYPQQPEGVTTKTVETSMVPKGGTGDANEFDPNLPQCFWSERRSRYEGAQQQAATSRYLAK